VIQEKYSQISPINAEELEKTEWTPKTIRSGVIAKNIGSYPLWKKDGSAVYCTLLQVSCFVSLISFLTCLQFLVCFSLQVLDNHVIRYIPPEKYVTTLAGSKKFKNRKPMGCLVVGAEATNPEKVSPDVSEVFLHI